MLASWSLLNLIKVSIKSKGLLSLARQILLDALALELIT
jgi:hypothetical protein